MPQQKLESLAMLEEEAASDKGYRKVYDHWKKYRTETFEWFGKAELAYANAAFGKVEP